LGSYTVLTLLGSLIWCFAFAGAGWAVARNWSAIDHGYRYGELALLAALGVVLVGAIVHRRRRGAGGVAGA
jgi:membrane protein DedA with SNARE-associated domain